MDFSRTDGLAGYRTQARQWAAEQLREEWLAQEHETGTHHNPVLHRLLAEQGILGAGWPKEYGGSDVDPGLADAIIEEISRRGLRMDGWITTWMVLHTINEVGSEQLKREVIPAALAGEAVIVLGYTEPSSGSDVAAAQTRAVPVDGGWSINGSKMFTSTAHMATHVFLLTRTNTQVPKHRGLTLFLVPLDLPGIEIRPIYTLGGQRTNTTFYNDVVVPDSARVGDVDAGLVGHARRADLRAQCRGNRLRPHVPAAAPGLVRRGRPGPGRSRPVTGCPRLPGQDRHRGRGSAG